MGKLEGRVPSRAGHRLPGFCLPEPERTTAHRTDCVSARPHLCPNVRTSHQMRSVIDHKIYANVWQTHSRTYPPNTAVYYDPYYKLLSATLWWSFFMTTDTVKIHDRPGPECGSAQHQATDQTSHMYIHTNSLKWGKRDYPSFPPSSQSPRDAYRTIGCIEVKGRASSEKSGSIANKYARFGTVYHQEGAHVSKYNQQSSPKTLLRVEGIFKVV